MPSRDFAYTPLTKPARENTSAVITAKRKMIAELKSEIWRPVKKMEMRSTSVPTNTPRTMPPDMNPAMSSHGGVGETSISSMPRKKNLDWKKVNEVLEYALVTMASMTRPGMTNVM